MRLVTKADACKELKVSLSTLDRWIASGNVQIRKEPRGRRHRVYVVMEDGGADGERISVSNAHGGEETVPEGQLSDKVSLAVAQERIRGLEELVAMLREQLRVEQDRYAGLLEDLRADRLVVRGTERQQAWWRLWWRRL